MPWSFRSHHRQPAPRPHTRSLLDAAVLERRLLFSATPLAAALPEDVLAGAGLEAADAASPSSSAPIFTDQDADQADAEDSQRRLELVFVDAAVEHREQMIDDLNFDPANADLEIFLLDVAEDGLDQISEILLDYDQVDAIHLLSHGNDGRVRLGNTWLDAPSLDGYAGQLSRWRDVLSEQADVLLYGCELAAGHDGRQLLEALAELTGADVAASTDDTGHHALGGDWDLEFRRGVIESPTLAPVLTTPTWRGLLASPEVVSTGERLVNDHTEDDQTLTSADGTVAVDGAGGTIVVWVDEAGEDNGSDVFAQRYDAQGNRLGSAFRVNVTSTGDQTSPVVAADQSGRFAIAWTSPDASGSGIFVRRFDANGDALDAADVLVTSGLETDDQRHAAIAANDANQIVLVWQSDGANEGLYAREFDFTTPAPGNQLAGTPLHVDSEPTAVGATVDLNESGRYVIVWDDQDQSWAQAYDFGAGSAAGAKWDISFGTTEDHSHSVGMLANGDFLVAYRRDDGLASGVWQTQVGVDGTVAFPERVSSLLGAHAPTLAVAEGGEYVIAMTVGDADGHGILARRFHTFGADDGLAFLVNQTEAGNQTHASVAIHDLDNFLVVWDGAGNRDGQQDDQGVYLRQYGTATVNQLPTADPAAGAAYQIEEGQSITLDGSNSSDPDGDTLSFAWDLDHDGIYGESFEPTTATAQLSWSTLLAVGIDDDGDYTIGLRVDDGKGGTATQTTTVTVANAAPTLVVSGSGHAVSGQSYELNLAATDPGDDTLMHWRIDWGDGTVEYLTGSATEATHTYSVAGPTHNVLVAAFDEDGPWSGSDVLVATGGDDAVLGYDGATGTPQSTMGSGTLLEQAGDLVIGPDGLLYVTGLRSDALLRFNSETGAPVDQFVPAGTAGLDRPTGLTFGPDGNLYVADSGGDRVLKFSGSDGQFLDVFVSNSSGGLDDPAGLTFGADGRLYVASTGSDRVLRYDGTTGNFVDVFVKQGAGGVDDPVGLAFDADGHLLVASSATDQVLRYDGTSGSFVDVWVSQGAGGLDDATGMTFAPDGSLYVASRQTGQVLRYDEHGNFVEVFADSLATPRGIALTPAHQVRVLSDANTSPTASNLTQSVAYLEDQAGVELADIVVVDPDMGETVTVSFVLDQITSGTLTTGGSGSGADLVAGGGGQWTLTGSVADVNATLAELSFVPTNNHDADANLTVRVRDSLGQGPAEGLILLDVWPVNDAPQLDLDGDDSGGTGGSGRSVTFHEDSGGVLIADPVDAMVTDVDSETLRWLSVSIANPVDGDSELLRADTTGTGLTATSSAGTLTIAGAASLQSYQQVLRTLEYDNLSEAPSADDRLVEVVASDGITLGTPVTATVSVQAVNDPPTITVPESVTVREDTPASLGGIRVGDPDHVGERLEVVLRVSDGTLTLDTRIEGGLDADAVNGNGTSRVTVLATTAELNRTLSAAGGLVFQGAPDKPGPETLVIAASDGSGSVDESVSLEVQPVNDAPVANNDRISADFANTIRIASSSLLGNDSDLENDSLQVVLVGAPNSGRLAVASDGSLIYTPAEAVSGRVTFRYVATDGELTSDVATVTLDIEAPVNLVNLQDSGDSAPETATENQDSGPNEGSQSDNESSQDQQSTLEVAGVTPHSMTIDRDDQSDPDPVRRSVIALQDDDGSGAAAETTRQTSINAGDGETESRGGRRNVRMRSQLSGSSREADAREQSFGSLAMGNFDPQLLWQDLGAIQSQLSETSGSAFVIAGQFAGVSGALSVGYVLWTVRSGLLATSLLAHLPAWSFVDPLLVLSELDDDDEDAEDDSLENLIEKKSEPQQPSQQRSQQPSQQPSQHANATGDAP